jgi:hypothetical protein
MDRKRHRRTDPRSLHTLVVIKCPPLGPAVDKIIVYDQPAVLADQFGTFIVMNELAATAFGAYRFSMILCFLLVFLDSLFDPVLQRFPFILEEF